MVCLKSKLPLVFNILNLISDRTVKLETLYGIMNYTL